MQLVSFRSRLSPRLIIGSSRIIYFHHPRTMSQKGVPSSTAAAQAQADAAFPTAASLGIENTSINTEASLASTIDDKQKTVIGSVLDLFAGRPSLKKLSLWTDDAVFNDPLTQAEGRKQFAAQWYGLEAAFSEIVSLCCVNLYTQ